MLANDADPRTLNLDGIERIDPGPIQQVLDLKPSSLLIVGGLVDHTPFKNIREDLPIAQVLSSKGDLKRAVSIRSNDDTAMKLVLDHLVALGHKNVIYVGPEGERVAEDRKRAFQAQAKKHRLKGAIVSTSLAKDENSGLTAALSALKQKPTALKGALITCFV